MKKIISLALVLVLCLSLCACGKEPAVVDPLLGKWEVKSTDFEGSFEFLEEGDTIVGKWTYYDYAQEKWGNFDFTVKEKTDRCIVLLIEDGTISEMYYNIIGNHLYLDGMLYTNTLIEVPVSNHVQSFGLLVNGQDYQVLDGVFMGMHVDDVEKALAMKLPLEAGGTKGNYDYYGSCDYYGTYWIDGDYFKIDLGFDSSMRLVHLEKLAHYQKDAVDAQMDTLSAIFDRTEYRKVDFDDGGYWDEYTWTGGDFTVTMVVYTSSGETESDWFAVTYYYSPTAE